MVGSTGSCSRACWAVRDVPPAGLRPGSDAVSASSRARTVASCSRGSVLRVDAAARVERELVVDGFATAGQAVAERDDLGDLLGAERQPRRAARSSRSVSASSVYGTCSSEHDVETASDAGGAQQGRRASPAPRPGRCARCCVRRRHRRPRACRPAREPRRPRARRSGDQVDARSPRRRSTRARAARRRGCRSRTPPGSPAGRDSQRGQPVVDPLRPPRSRPVCGR